MSKDAKLFTILVQLPNRYSSFETLRDHLCRAKVIAVHTPYKGKHPKNPRYIMAQSP